jgi:alpha-tubulin suppressor-like RCC1 family protein
MLLLRSKLLVMLPKLLVVALLIGAGWSLRTAPRASANPLTGFVTIGSGATHTCALMTGGGVKCWGGNANEQLGAPGAGSVIPVNVSLSASVAQLDAGLGVGCVVESTTGVQCWGEGIGVPSTPSGWGFGIAQVSAGWLHHCAVTTSGGVKCFGDNRFGQLGNGTWSFGGSPVPVDVTGLTSGASVVAAGTFGHTCALTTSGGVKCWGDNSVGQLGAPSSDICFISSVCSQTPVDVTGLASGATAISVGRSDSCAVLSAGGVKCWGFMFGPTPVTIAGLGGPVAQVGVGDEHVCFRMGSGGVKCQGRNLYGQLGDGTTMDRASPVDVVGLGAGVTDLSAGIYHNCVVLSTAQAKCWGDNLDGQLGNGASSGLLPNPVPVDVVVAAQKPTPTPTPCGPGGCPTATPTPTSQPTSGVGFSLGIDVNGDNLNDCGTRPSEPAKCSIPIGAQFQVRFFLNSLPVGVPLYGGYDAHALFQGIATKHMVQLTDWPGCSLAAGPAYLPGVVAFGCTVGVGAPNSSYLGLMARMTFTCTASGSVSLLHGQGNTELVSPGLIQYTEGENIEESLDVNCLTLPAPTPTPQSVGGVALDPLASGGGNSAWWVLLAAGAPFVVSASASFVARRAQRR